MIERVVEGILCSEIWTMLWCTLSKSLITKVTVAWSNWTTQSNLSCFFKSGFELCKKFLETRCLLFRVFGTEFCWVLVLEMSAPASVKAVIAMAGVVVVVWGFIRIRHFAFSDVGACQWHKICSDGLVCVNSCVCPREELGTSRQRTSETRHMGKRNVINLVSYFI